MSYRGEGKLPRTLKDTSSFLLKLNTGLRPNYLLRKSKTTGTRNDLPVFHSDDLTALFGKTLIMGNNNKS